MSLLQSLLVIAALSLSCGTFAATNPESIIAPPDQDATDNVIDYDVYWIYRNGYSVGVGGKDKKVKGISFINNGGNSTVVEKELFPGDGPARYFTFGFKDRARQDMQLWVSDTADSVTSNYLESIFYFFPRYVLPAIDLDPTNSNRFIVTLPTRETVTVDRVSKVFLDGVLKEYAPLDMNPVVSKRKFAQISYSGKGLYLRTNMRANSPQLAKTATVYLQGKTCQVPGKDVFNQSTSGAMTFKFATDAQFNAYLIKKCNFSIPNF